MSKYPGCNKAYKYELCRITKFLHRGNQAKQLLPYLQCSHVKRRLLQKPACICVATWKLVPLCRFVAVFETPARLAVLQSLLQSSRPGNFSSLKTVSLLTVLRQVALQQSPDCASTQRLADETSWHSTTDVPTSNCLEDTPSWQRLYD